MSRTNNKRYSEHFWLVNWMEIRQNKSEKMI